MTIMSEHRVGASRHMCTVFEAGVLGSLADGQLLERFLAGRGDEDSAASFAALAERHGPMVLSVCRAAPRWTTCTTPRTRRRRRS
jgi:RNA polymerase sigma-70 factor (ECF subfamily)